MTKFKLTVECGGDLLNEVELSAIEEKHFDKISEDLKAYNVSINVLEFLRDWDSHSVVFEIPTRTFQRERLLGNTLVVDDFEEYVVDAEFEQYYTVAKTTAIVTLERIFE